MKRNRFLSLLICLVLLLSLVTPSFAAQNQSIEVSPINVMVGGKIFLPTDANGKDVPVFAYNGTTYAPLRALAEAYGLTVGYNAEKKLATVDGTPSADFVGTKGTAQALTKRTTLTVSSINIEVNGEVFQPKDVNGKAVSVFAYNGTTYAPLRALAEAYGLTVGYDSEKKLATVDFVGETSGTSFVTWDGTVAQKFAKGSGSNNNPYIIETPQELALLASKVNSGDSFAGKFFLLANDLDLAYIEWTPIGSYSNGFNGHFDGAGHTITGLSITKADIDPSGVNYWHDSIECVGLFGLAGNKSYIGNLYIEGIIDINKPDAPEKDDVIAGGIVGLTRGTVYNCHNACDISVSIQSDGTYINIGGVSGCYTWETGLIDSCSNMGTLFGQGIHVVRIGGVCGDNDGHGTVRNCVNFGSIRADGTMSDYVGGIVAHTANSTIYNCANYGTVQGSDSIGGIVGRQYGTDSFGGDACVINCLSVSTVIADNRRTYAGAICGDVVYGTIDMCYYDGSDRAVDNMNNALVQTVISSSKMTGEELLKALNSWVNENNAEDEIYTTWTLDSHGRVVPITN